MQSEPSLAEFLYEEYRRTYNRGRMNERDLLVPWPGLSELEQECWYDVASEACARLRNV